MATAVTSTADLLDSSGSVESVSSTSIKVKDDADHLASRILLYSFAAAVLLAIAGFAVVAAYLFVYLHHAFAAFDTNAMAQLTSMDAGKMQTILLARAGLWKFILQSCGIVSGVAFGFLGFGLFLLGAKGDMDAAFDDSQHKVQLSRMAPGSFVILIAAVLIGICSTKKVDLAFSPVVTQTSTSGGGLATAPNPLSSDSSIPDMNQVPASDTSATLPTAPKKRPVK